MKTISYENYLIEEGHLEVSNVHSIYYAVYGNKEGIPVITVHGGPGSNSKPKHISYYNLEKFKVILFDQRGCGKSLPAGEIKENSTQNTLDDMESIRSHFEIDKWIVTGGSWGSTIALLYAQAYEEKVLGLFLSSIFLARPEDDAWLFGESGVAKLFPDLWKDRVEFLKEKGIDKKNYTDPLLEILEKGTEKEKKEIALWAANWEGNLLDLFPEAKMKKLEDVELKDIGDVRIFLHYEKNNYFLEPNQILENMEKIEDIRAGIVHSRNDVVCPLEQATLTVEKFKNVKFEITHLDGHRLGPNSKRMIYYMFDNMFGS